VVDLRAVADQKADLLLVAADQRAVDQKVDLRAVADQKVADRAEDFRPSK
jgi:hypothetical protein